MYLAEEAGLVEGSVGGQNVGVPQETHRDLGCQPSQLGHTQTRSSRGEIVRCRETVLELFVSLGPILPGVGQSLHKTQEDVAEEGESSAASLSLPVSREHLHTQVLVDVEVLIEKRKMVCQTNHNINHTSSVFDNEM